MNNFSSVDLMCYRQAELTDVAQLLTKEAQRVARLATIIKISLILLGALVVTREVANQIFGTSNLATIIIYALLCLLIAI